MDVLEHKKKFDEIIKKYSLHTEKNAVKISQFLTQNKKVISSEEFAKEFGMDIKDSDIFLQFIQKGVMFKKEIDSSKKL